MSTSSTLLKFGLGAACAAALVAAAAVTVHGRSRRDADELRALRDKVEALEADPPARIVTIREPAATVAPAMAAAPATEAPSASDSATGRPSLTEEERHRRLAAINEARSAACDTTHAREAPDPAWSATAADTIRGRLVGDDFRGVTAEVDCRRTMCKVDLQYADATSGLSAAKQLGSLRLWPGQTFWHLDQERLTGTAYIAREGFQLPAEVSAPPAATSL